MRLACLEAAGARPRVTPVRERAEWVNTEKELVPLLRQRQEFTAKKSLFFVEDFDPTAVDYCFSLLTQMEGAVDLNALLRWGSHSNSKSAHDALALLTSWQQRFHLNEQLCEMFRSLVRMQHHWFARTDHFHLHSDGLMLMAVWEGKAIEGFGERGPRHLLDLEKLPHSVFFNHRSGENAQLAVVCPLTTPVGLSGLLRCLVMIVPQDAECAPLLLGAG